MIVDSEAPRTYYVSEPEAGRKIIRFLQRILPGVPSSRLFRALRTAEIRVNGHKVPRDYVIRPGDCITLPQFVLGIKVNGERQSDEEDVPGKGAARKPTSRPRGIRIIYEDDEILVVFKPPGLPVHGGSRITGATLTQWVRSHLAIPDSTYQPSPVHRIDRPASGLVVYARTLRAHQHLAQLFAEKSSGPVRLDSPLQKVYLALTNGKPPATYGTIELPVSEKKIASPGQSARVAVSNYRVLDTKSSVSLLELRPIQGRTHQLRLHLSHAGIPILGDKRYGGAFPGIYRPLLHLWQLSFPSLSGKLMRFNADPPPDFLKVMKRFGLGQPQSAPQEASASRKQPRSRRINPRK